MKIQVHPAFTHYEKFIRNIPEEKYSTEEVFCNVRNTVIKVKTDDRIFVIKKYKVPNLFNRIVYTWFRKSKARRSFEYADRLLNVGIETALPVAYIEEKKNGFFHTGYFISEFLPYQLLPDISKYDKSERELLKKDFLHFTVHLHELKIIHKDYNAMNVLFYKKDGHYYFALIDINRMSFGVHNLRLCMQSVNQLHMSVEKSSKFVEDYAKLRDLDPIACLIILFKNRKSLQNRERAKKVFKEKILRRKQ